MSNTPNFDKDRRERRVHAAASHGNRTATRLKDKARRKKRKLFRAGEDKRQMDARVHFASVNRQKRHKENVE